MEDKGGTKRVRKKLTIVVFDVVYWRSEIFSMLTWSEYSS